MNLLDTNTLLLFFNSYFAFRHFEREKKTQEVFESLLT